MMISDLYQNKGLGREFLRRLIEIGRAEKITRIAGDILADNLAMMRVCKRCGFRLRTTEDGRLVKADLDL